MDSVHSSELIRAPFHKIFTFQAILLRPFGFSSCGKQSPASRRFSAMLTTSGIGFLLFACAVYVYEFFNNAKRLSDDRAIGILGAVSALPIFVVSFRGQAVLAVFLLKRRFWISLCQLGGQVINTIVSQDKERTQEIFRKWKTMAVVAGTVALLTHGTLEVVTHVEKSIRHFTAPAHKISNSTRGETDTAWSKPESLPLYVMSSVVPFMISQQVCVILGMICKVLGDCTKILNTQIKQQRVRVSRLCLCRNKDSLKSMFSTAELGCCKNELEKMMTHYDLLNSFSEQINDMFRLIFGISYGMDVLTMLGYTVTFVATMHVVDSAEFIMSKRESISGIIIYGVYTCVTAVPLIYSYEKALEVPKSLLIYAKSALPVLQTNQGYGLKVAVETFMCGCKENTMIFHIADLFYVTRPAVFTTFTLIMTFALIANEVFGPK